jgi:uncharacterized membrane protein SpoIIM required for sporulation
VISRSWLSKRRPHWTRLNELLIRSDKNGICTLGHKELQELALLYRQTASDLATVREDPSTRSLALDLNQLLGRAHNRIYMGGRARASGILTFYRDVFPQVFRETLPYTVTACLIFAAMVVVGWVVSLAEPGFQRYFLGTAMLETIEQHKMWTHSIVSIKPLASSAIVTNNLTVSFTTFAFGVTAGIGTAWMLAFNGLLFGVVSAACWQAGMANQLFSFVAPHGVLELPAIFIAGGGGLLIAKGLLFPGTLPRTASLVKEGGRAVRLALGIVPLLIVAGGIEGFISPTDLPSPLKYLLASVMFMLFVVYVTRKAPRARKGVPLETFPPTRAGSALLRQGIDLQAPWTGR